MARCVHFRNRNNVFWMTIRGVFMRTWLANKKEPQRTGIPLTFWHVLIVLFLSGCGTSSDYQNRKADDVLSRLSSHPQLGFVNLLGEPFRREYEWKFNHMSMEDPPQKCLALSGGGIRSAAFSIGILRGLERKGILHTVDVISAVSGGGYAVGWLYEALRQNSHLTLAGAFDDSELNRLVRRSTFIGEKSSNIVASTLFLPLQILENGLASLNRKDPYMATNESGPFGRIYANAIADTFLGGNKTTRLQDLIPTIRKHRLPFFLLNASIIPALSDSLEGTLLAPSVELSPLRLWSALLGTFSDQSTMRKNDFLWSFSHAINGDDRRDLSYLHDALSISGAAIDFHGKASGKGLLTDYVGFNLGRHFALDGPAQNSYRYIYLADGGKAENLGVIPLVLRRCNEILIVDGEYDPQYHFGAYVKLKRVLKNDFKTTLEIPELDKILNSSEINDELTGELCQGKGCRLGEFDGKKPAYYGTISIEGYTYIDANYKPRRIYQWPDQLLKIAYVKLSLNARDLIQSSNQPPLASYPESLSTYISAHKDSNCSSSNPYSCQSPFPQIDTIKQIFTPDQMRAFIDLGTYFVDHELQNWPVRQKLAVSE